MSVLTDKVSEYSADMPDWKLAETLNTPDGETYGYSYVDIPCDKVRTALMATGEWIAVKEARSNNNVLARNAAELLFDLLTLENKIQYSNELYRETINNHVAILVGANVISQDTVNAVLLGIGRQPLSWAEKNLGQKVDAREIGLARGGK